MQDTIEFWAEQLKTWTVVGPWEEAATAADICKPLPLDGITTLPAASETLHGDSTTIRQVRLTGNKLDLREHLGGPRGMHSQGYAFVEIEAPEDGRLDLAYDADWWAVWWLDGNEVAATRNGNGFPLGNMANPITLRLTRGRHLLGVRVIGGDNGWVLLVRARAWEAARPAPHARFRMILNDILPRYDMVWRYPHLPVDWMNGAPIGNGDFGATVHGMPNGLTLTFGKTNVWQRYDHEADVFPAPFAEFRRICREQDAEAYRRMAAETMRQHPGRDSHQTTCGTLRLQLNAGINPIDPVMRLRLRDGVMQLTYTTACVTAYVSHAYDVLVLDVDRGVSVDSLPCWPGFTSLESLPWQLMRPLPDKDHPNPPAQLDENDGVYYLTQDVGRGESFTIGLRGLDFSAARHVTLPNQLAGQFTKPQGRNVGLLITIVSSRDAADPRALCRERLERAACAGRQTIFEAHCRRWDDYWMNGLASVGDATVEKMYYRSLYLCGAMLRPGCQSPGLQGVWCGELATPWNSDYHANINIQSVYWGLFANNRLELVEPYLRLYQGFAEHSRKVARDIFGMRGLHFPFAASLEGHDFSRGWFFGNIYDPSSTAWLARLFWQYYEYSQDRAWLRDTGYPILRDVARFLSDYLQRDSATGGYLIAPSVHHETRHLSDFGVNAHYAQAWFRVGLQQAIRASELLNADARERDEWRDRLSHLAEPSIENGMFKIMENRPLDASGKTFLNWVTMVFPAELVSRFHGPERWQRAALATWEYAKSRQTGSRAWCGGLGIGDILRLGDVDTAFREARWVDQQPTSGNTNIMQENGFTVSAQGDYIQLDHIPGMCRVLADMMLLGLDGVIHLFPGIPRNVPARFFNLRAPGGFLLSAEKRGREPDYAIVRATVAATLKLANPWPGGVVTIRDADSGRVLGATRDTVLTTELVPERSCLIAPEGFDPDHLPVVDFMAFVSPVP